MTDIFERANSCGASHSDAELGAELPGKRSRAMLPLLEEIAERDAEIERLRQRVAELEELSESRYLLSESAINHAARCEAELAALKERQGEPTLLHQAQLPNKIGLWLDESGKYYKLAALKAGQGEIASKP